MIVDDQEENRYLLQVTLQAQGCTVRSARNGIEALEMARRELPDLIITYILMPGMDGFTLCREWVADERLRRIPLVFYTATYTDPADEAFALSLGAARFIVKPVEPDAFVEIVRQVLANHSAQRLVPHEESRQVEETYYQQYSQTLIRKLEDKMAQLEESNRSLERDIAERKQGETALLEERNLLRMLMDSVPDSIYFKDAESRFIRINKTIARNVGLSDAAQAVGKTDSDLFSAELARQTFADEQAIMQSGEPIVDKEEKETWPDGRVTWVSTTKMPLRDQQGQIVGTFGVSHLRPGAPALYHPGPARGPPAPRWR